MYIYIYIHTYTYTQLHVPCLYSVHFLVFSIYVPLMFVKPIMFRDLGNNLNSNGLSLSSEFLYVSVSYFGYVCLDLCLYNLFTFYIVFSLER